MSLAKICFSRVVINRAKINTSVLVGTVLKNVSDSIAWGCFSVDIDFEMVFFNPFPRKKSIYKSL